MSVRGSIRRAEARFKFERETKPRLQREAAERMAKIESQIAEAAEKRKALYAEHDAQLAAMRATWGKHDDKRC